MVQLKQTFGGDKIPKEGVHHTCIAWISTDSVMRIETKNYPQGYLEECKNKIKKIKMPEFIDFELESYSTSDSEWLHLSFIYMRLFQMPVCPFEVEFYPEPQSFYRTNLPWLFQMLVIPFEVEFYHEQQSFYRTNLPQPFTEH